MQHIINKITPFILFGVAIVAFIFGVMLFTYLFLFGALVGLVLFVINWLRNKFFVKKKAHATVHKNMSGRIIDSNDWKKL